MEWVILLVVLLVVFGIFQLRHMQHRFFLFLLFIIILLFFFTFTGVVSKSNIDLKSPAGTLQAIKVYGIWLGQAFSNVRTIVGNAVKMDWVPEGHNSSELDPRNYMTG